MERDAVTTLKGSPKGTGWGSASKAATRSLSISSVATASRPAESLWRSCRPRSSRTGAAAVRAPMPRTSTSPYSFFFASTVPADPVALSHLVDRCGCRSPGLARCAFGFPRNSPHLPSVGRCMYAVVCVDSAISGAHRRIGDLSMIRQAAYQGAGEGGAYSALRIPPTTTTASAR